MLFGIYGLLWGMALSNFNIFMVNALLASRYTGYKFHRQLCDILPILGLSGLCMTITYFLKDMVQGYFFLTILIYAIIYLGLAFLMRMAVLGEIKMIATRFMNKRA